MNLLVPVVQIPNTVSPPKNLTRITLPSEMYESANLGQQRALLVSRSLNLAHEYIPDAISSVSRYTTLDKDFKHKFSKQHTQKRQDLKGA